MFEENFSVLMPVHHSEAPSHLADSIASIDEQSFSPSELILVKDESVPNPELTEVISSQTLDIVVEPISESHTLGRALQRGLEVCSCDVVARMDSDDIAEHTRFERQLDFLSTNPDIAAVGSYVAEFVDSIKNPTGIRKVPLRPDEIGRKARHRCPMNHPSVMFRKEPVMEVGGYRNITAFEDYDLWSRLLLQGYKLANIPDVLVYARAGEDLYTRRGGIDYAWKEFNIQKTFLERGFTTVPTFLFNLTVRLPIRMLPNAIRGWIYRMLLRD